MAQYIEWGIAMASAEHPLPSQMLHGEAPKAGTGQNLASHKRTRLSQTAEPVKNRFNSLVFLSTEVFSKRRKTCAL